MQNAMCSSSGTPSSSAPWRTSSRFTPRANALSFSFFFTEETSRSLKLLDGRTSAHATRNPHSSSTANNVFAIGVSPGTPPGVRRPQTTPARGSRTPTPRAAAARKRPWSGAGSRPRPDVPRSASARHWETSRNRNRAAGPRAPRSPDPRRTLSRRRASRLPPRACAGAATLTACARASGRVLRRASSERYPPALAPERQHELRPQPPRVIASAGPVLGEERCVEQTVGERGKAGVQPAGDRHRESPLLPADHIGGDEGAGRPLLYRLGRVPTALGARGGRQHQLHEFTVQEWRAGLDRREHRGPVDLHQQIVRQIGQEIEPHDPVERIVMREIVELAGELRNNTLLDLERSKPGQMPLHPRPAGQMPLHPR